MAEHHHRDHHTSTLNVLEEGFGHSKKEEVGRLKQTDLLCKPIGVLAVHVKQLRNVKLDTESQFMSSSVNLYLRIHVGHKVKNTVVVPISSGKQLAFDDIKHFLVQLSNRRHDSSNKMRIELVGFETKNTHKIIAKHDTHTYCIVKNLYVAETIPLKRRDKLAAELDIEFCFAYGMCGYGFANQLENHKIDPSDQITHSMFFRGEPPSSRRDTARDLITSFPVGHPAFVNFKEKADIGTLGRELRSSMSVAHPLIHQDPVLLMSKIKQRVIDLQERYETLPNRIQKMQFLRDMVAPKVVTSENAEFFINTPNVKLRLKGDVLDTVLEGVATQKQPDIINLKGVFAGLAKKLQPQKQITSEMRTVLHTAPGITTRSDNRPETPGLPPLGPLLTTTEPETELVPDSEQPPVETLTVPERTETPARNTLQSVWASLLNFFSKKRN